MAYAKGEPVWRDKEKGIPEPGIWHLTGREDLYLAEVNLKDPITGKRIRERKVSDVVAVLRNWRIKRKNAETSGELEKERSQKRIKFSEFASEYYEDWGPKCKESTAKTEKNRIEGILNAYFGNWDITTITRKDVETFLRKRRDGSLDHIIGQGRKNGKMGGVTTATINRDLCRLKNMFKKAVEWSYLKENPAIGIPQVKEVIPKFKYLERDEAAAFLKVCEKEYRPIFVTAIYTGMRYGELMKLTWQDVKWGFNLLHIRKPKNNEDRYVPMIEDVQKEIGGLIPVGKTKADLEKSDEPVFVNSATGKPFVDVRRAMNRALKKAGVIDHVRFHDLRHTTGSHLAMNGSTEVEIAEFLGHKDTTVTRRYTHISKPHLQAVANRLNFSEQPKKKQRKRTPKKAVSI